ncbi:MAG: hypothetical protein JSU70_16255 [Phycisphaerales bacterium]|nr:MAG: hypothetical protein JSU70_16255 [Phycisphaerales bacterium]
MELVIKILGVAFVCLGLVVLLKPAVFRPLLQFFRKGKRIYLAALTRFALAIVFLLAARECDMPWVIGCFGVLFLLAGLLTFALGPKRTTPMIDWFLKQSALVVRSIAVLILIIGAVIIYAA